MLGNVTSRALPARAFSALPFPAGQETVVTTPEAPEHLLANQIAPQLAAPQALTAPTSNPPPQALSEPVSVPTPPAPLVAPAGSVEPADSMPASQAVPVVVPDVPLPPAPVPQAPVQTSMPPTPFPAPQLPAPPATTPAKHAPTSQLRASAPPQKGLKCTSSGSGTRVIEQAIEPANESAMNPALAISASPMPVPATPAPLPTPQGNMQPPASPASTPVQPLAPRGKPIDPQTEPLPQDKLAFSARLIPLASRDLPAAPFENIPALHVTNSPSTQPESQVSISTPRMEAASNRDPAPELTRPATSPSASPLTPSIAQPAFATISFRPSGAGTQLAPPPSKPARTPAPEPEDSPSQAPSGPAQPSRIAPASPTSSAGDPGHAFEIPLPLPASSDPPSVTTREALFSAGAPTQHLSEPQGIAPPQTHVPSVQDITVRIAQPEAPSVDLHVTQRGGEIQVAVRTPDAALQTSLRQNLNVLTTSLERAGYRADAIAPSSAASSQTNSRELDSESSHDASADSRDRRQQPQQQHQQQQNQRDQRAARWLDELELTQ